MQHTQNQNNETLLDNEIPAKFKDPKTGALCADKMLKSYKELEKKLSSTPSAPKTYKDYKVKCDHGLFTSDEEISYGADDC